MELDRNTIELFASLHQKGRLEEAEQGYRQILQKFPQSFDALQLLAALVQKRGDLEEASSLYARALEIDGTVSEVQSNYGCLLLKQGEVEAAITQFNEALAKSPHYFAALKNRGLAFDRLQDYSSAANDYAQCCQISPQDYEMWVHKGLCEFKLTQFQDAITSYTMAIEIEPNYHHAYYCKSKAVRALRQYEEAESLLNAALSRSPGYLPALLQMAEIHFLKNEHSQSYIDAISILNTLTDNSIPIEHKLGDWIATSLHEQDTAIRLQKLNRRALLLKGASLYQLGQVDSAIEAYSEVLALNPGDLDGLEARGAARMKNRDFTNALQDFRLLLSLDTQDTKPFAAGSYLNACRCACEWEDVCKYEEIVYQRIESGVECMRPFLFLATTDSARMQSLCSQQYKQDLETVSRKWHEDFFLGRKIQDRGNESKKIRIAYISADFRHHAVSFLTAGLFEHHNKEQFEIIAVSFKSADNSEYCHRIFAASDQFIDASDTSDIELAQLLVSLDIDIAVDLMGFTDFSRPHLFATRVAPIQINYLGYPATMGKSFIDYIIADNYVIPANSQEQYGEHVIYLPNCFQPNDNKRRIAAGKPSRASLGLPESGFVFCTANQPQKIHPLLFRCWMNILSRVENSVLWIVGINADTKANLDVEAAKAGVDSDRLFWSGKAYYPQHLSRLRVADLMLDTWPFNGGTTTSDALWSGVPVVTLSGEAFSSRMSGSLLQSIGLNELIVDSMDHYQDLAIRLASDKEQLGVIRTKLWENRTKSPLFNTEMFTRNLEKAYVLAQEQYLQGEKFENIYVNNSASSFS
jgi:protein O-GlcNAc transferase